MKRLLLICFVLLPTTLLAHESTDSDWLRRGIHIKEVTVYGKRPMKEIGTQQTKFDSVILKENIALSMADLGRT